MASQPQPAVFASKKTIIILLVFAGFISLGLLIALNMQKDAANEVGITPSPSVTDFKHDAVNETPLSPTGIPSILLWNTHHGETYSFQHPKNWTVQKFSIAGGGESLLVKPDVLPDGIYYPQFILQTQPADADVISRKEGVFAGFGMTKQLVVVDNSEAIKYKGTIPFKSVGIETVNEPIQDTTYLLEKNGTVYVLKFEYEGAVPNAGLDEFFEGFISSFKTK